ncbi:MAG: tetratricopeptide repeat protein [bacterium]|nr:tetratricopeptide repeat protein [bacterium]
MLLSLTGACSDSGPLNETQLKRFTEAQTLYRNKKFDEALSRLRQLREERPDALEAASLEARILFFTKKFEESEQVLKEVLDRDPENPHALMWLGKTIAVDAERQAEAAEHFRAIVERDPENYMARYYLGRCLEAQNKIRPALLEYQAALAMEYQISKIHLHMGRLLSGINMEDRAKKHFARVRALGVSPGDMQLAARAEASPETEEEAKAGGTPRR